MNWREESRQRTPSQRDGEETFCLGTATEVLNSSRALPDVEVESKTCCWQDKAPQIESGTRV